MLLCAPILTCEHASHDDVIQAIDSIFKSGVHRLTQELHTTNEPLTNTSGNNDAVITCVIFNALGTLDVRSICCDSANSAAANLKAQEWNLVTRILEAQDRTSTCCNDQRQKAKLDGHHG